MLIFSAEKQQSKNSAHACSQSFLWNINFATQRLPSLIKRRSASQGEAEDGGDGEELPEASEDSVTRLVEMLLCRANLWANLIVFY